MCAKGQGSTKFCKIRHYFLLFQKISCIRRKKELFEGLKIMDLEKEWIKHPVIRLDMSLAGAEPELIRGYLDDCFYEYEGEVVF